VHDRIALTARALQPAAPCIIFLPACLICARMRGQMDEWPPKVGFAGDSPLEEAGFELPKIEASHAVIVLASCDIRCT
jgi:hypothetical protein